MTLRKRVKRSVTEDVPAVPMTTKLEEVDESSDEEEEKSQQQQVLQPCPWLSYQMLEYQSRFSHISAYFSNDILSTDIDNIFDKNLSTFKSRGKFK